MGLFQCFPVFTLQLYLKSMVGKLGKTIYFIQGDTEMFKVLLAVFFFAFLSLDSAFNRQRKRYFRLSMEKNLLDTLCTLHHCLCTQNSANFRKQYFGIIFLTGSVQIRK